MLLILKKDALFLIVEPFKAQPKQNLASSPLLPKPNPVPSVKTTSGAKAIPVIVEVAPFVKPKGT